MLKIILISLAGICCVLGVLVLFFSKMESNAQEKTKEKEIEEKGEGGATPPIKKTWREKVPIPAHTWQLLVLLVITYLVIWKFFPSLWDVLKKSQQNKFWFLFPSLGGLLIVTFFELVKKKSVVLIAVGIIVFQIISGLLQSGVSFSFTRPTPKQTQEKVVCTPTPKGVFEVVAPADKYGECIEIPNNRMWRYNHEGEGFIMVQRMDTGYSFRSGDNRNYSSIKNPKGIRFKSLTGKDETVQMWVKYN